MLSLMLVVSAAASLAVLQVDAQSRSYRCQSREGRQPNFSDDSCATFLVCSNYSGQLRRCRGGQQYDFSSQSCKADSEVACQQQLRNRPSNPSSTPTSPPSTENSRESARSNTLLTLLNALFPQQANNGGIVGLQGNIPPGILPGGLQGIVGAGPFGVQGAAPQAPNQGLFLNFLGNNANAGLGAQAGGITGLVQYNNLQGGALGNQLDNDLFGGVVDQNVNVVNANGQRAKALNGPAFSPSQKPNNFVPNFNQNSPYIPILNQVPQSFLPNTPVAQAFAGNQIPQSQTQYTSESQIPNPSDSLEQETKPQLTVTFSQLPQPQSPDIYSQVPQYQPPYTAESFNQFPQSQFSDTPQSQSQYGPVRLNEVPKETTYSNVPQLSGILK
uniref:Chitin-binding type-2 domain-containing protein n=1 Tax=Biomphalaria glabrata TaxID=6526 RepID=A0A2C9L6J2_BIOGL